MNRWPGDAALDAVGAVEQARQGQVASVTALLDAAGVPAHLRELLSWLVAIASHRLDDAELAELRERVLQAEVDADPAGPPTTTTPEQKRRVVLHGKVRFNRIRNVARVDLDDGTGRIARGRITLVVALPDDG